MRIDEINDLLFEQIKARSDKNIKDNELGQEVERSKAMALLASQYLAGETIKLRQENVRRLTNGNSQLAD